MSRRLTDAVTALAAQTFPPSRRADGLVVRDQARDSIDASGVRAMARESASVAFAGLRVRLGATLHDVRHAPWRPALAALTLPLSAALLCVWTFGFLPRYDHWPLGEGWMMLLGGSLLAVIGAALQWRWPIVVGAGAAFVAAAAPNFGWGTEVDFSGRSSFFQGAGVDLGVSSLLPALLLIAAALSLPRRPALKPMRVLDRLVLGLLPTAIALVHLLPRGAPEPTLAIVHMQPGEPPLVQSAPPYEFPWIPESETLLTALGVAFVVAVVLSWRAARRRPEAALATALVLMSVAYPLAWKLHGYRIWPTILIPLVVAVALTLRAAHAARRSSSATPASSSAPAPSR
jgi:hypothetical protein